MNLPAGQQRLTHNLPRAVEVAALEGVVFPAADVAAVEAEDGKLARKIIFFDKNEKKS